MKWGNTQLQITFLQSISCSSKLVCPCFFYLTGTSNMFPISQIHCHIFKLYGLFFYFIIYQQHVGQHSSKHTKQKTYQ